MLAPLNNQEGQGEEGSLRETVSANMEGPDSQCCNEEGCLAQ